MTSLDGATERMMADALDRYWDGLASAHPGGPSRPDELLDPSLQRSVRRLRLVDGTPGPDPIFAARLRSELLTMANQPAASSPAAGTRRFGSLARRRVLVELVVAAALLLAVLGGGPVLKLPVSLDPAAPTVAASAATGSAGFAAVGTCAQTVTPEPTAAARLVPAPTRLPEPTTGAVSKSCAP